MVTSVDPNAIRAARERAGLTQHELARLVGAAGGERVSRWERGTSEPRPDFVVKLARALKLDAVELLDLGTQSSPDLRALRILAGLSVRDAAARVYVSQPNYKRWEAGAFVRPLTTRNLTALAQAFDVSIETARTALENAAIGRRGTGQSVSTTSDPDP